MVNRQIFNLFLLLTLVAAGPLSAQKVVAAKSSTGVSTTELTAPLTAPGGKFDAP